MWPSSGSEAARSAATGAATSNGRSSRSIRRSRRSLAIRISSRIISACDPDVPVVLGDARLTLAASRERFDLIILDAFSSDVVPVHLLTREAIEGYLARLEDGGVIVLHLSNRYMELGSVVAAAATAQGLAAAFKDDDRALTVPFDYKANASVAVLAHRRADLGDLLQPTRLARDRSLLRTSGSGPTIIRTCWARSCASGSEADRARRYPPQRDGGNGASASASSRSMASAWRTDSRRTCARPISPNSRARWLRRPPREAAAKCTSPTGLPGGAPPGPAMPVIATARSTPRARERAARHGFGGLAAHRAEGRDGRPARRAWLSWPRCCR